MPTPKSSALAAFFIRYLIEVIVLIVLPALTAPYPAFCAEPAGASYTINFPKNARVAQMHVTAPHEYSPGAKKTIVTARGKVTLPRVCDITLNLCYDGMQNMDLIEQIDENSLRRFSAAKLDFDDGQMAHLKKFKHIVSLNLDDTLVSDKSLPVIGGMTEMSLLRFNGTDITGGGFGALANLNNLWNFNMGSINLKAGSMASLKGATKHIGDITCSRVGLTAVDLQTIGQMQSLPNLCMDGNKAIGDDCVKYLLPLKKLETLNIADTGITEKSLPELYKLPSLRLVKVRNHQFWLGGAVKRTKPGITFEDNETKTRIPLVMFRPLH
jgi:hypothetical protein